ncbi:cobalt-zinc-cadmium efflux system outer membrane protein [Pseudoduganella flava]|uniref:Cobalt-zinc-cadmium efflux system outer membrane protein n=1 Tax=Pseudoduganella flava TaxID=871742 RepID=A0A562P920_9BURK|nr:TolC family protein [Pseudoduganella flava]QGZ38030.1 TolC family protein [Pseudoduganella flava]TWI40965.1 cobalt-zinc-cadmium efflux system outer membrane protein [Pseudoduganella flava]
MTRPLLTAVAAVFVLCRGPAWAEAQAPSPATLLDLPAALRLAAERDPTLRAAAHEVAASDAAVDQAGRLPNPELAYLREGQRAGTRTTTVQINQPLELGGKRQARIALANGALDVARGELALRRQALRADVTLAYYTVLAAQERQRLAQAAADLAARSLGAADIRVAAGKVSPIEAGKARLAQAEAQAALGRATAELAIARTRLAAFIGARADEPLASADAAALPDPGPLAPLLDRAADGPALLLARRQVVYQQAQTDVAKSARVPDVTLTIGSQRDDQLARRQAVVGIAVPLPLFDRNGGNVVAASERAAKARAELEAAQRDVTADATTAWLRYRQARDEALLMQNGVVADAASVHALTLKGYEYGKFAFLDVLDAQRTLFAARSRLLDAMLDAWRAHADLARLTGALTTE